MKTTFKEYALTHAEQFEVLQATIEASSSANQYGPKLENLFYNLCIQSGIRITRSTREEDLLLGYDFKLSWTEEDKNYSIMVDLTAKDKKGIDYFTYSGSLKERYKDMFGGGYFSAAIGLKKMHASRFIYHTPVYVVNADVKWRKLPDYEAEFNFFLLSLKRLHMQSNNPRRASQVIYLNQ